MIFRIIPNLKVPDAGAGHDFYTGYLGLEKAFDLGWVASFRSPENRSIQVSLVSGDASAPEDSAISVNVDDVDAAYTEARRRGYEIVHPLTEEPWGPRRFFVRDPNGVVVNVVGHPTDSPAAVTPTAGPRSRVAPSMTGMDMTTHSTVKRLRLVRRTEAVRNR